MSPGRGRRHALVLLVIAVALVAAGCGSSSKKAASATTTSVDPNATYTLMYITDATGNQGYTTGTNKLFEGAVKAANARGGIKGHQIKLVTCDSQSNNNAAAACGQQAVTEKAFAVISFAASGTFFPYVENAKIPVFSEGITKESWASPVSFMLANGLIGGSAGYIALLKQQGCKTVGMIATVAPGSAANIDSLSHSMELEATALGGIEYKGYIPAPITAPDLAPYATQAVDKGYECVVPLAFGPSSISLLNAVSSLVQSGKIKKVGICTCIITPQVLTAITVPIKKLGDAAVMSLSMESPQNTTNPAVKQWVADQTTPGETPNLEFQGGMQWAELQLAIHAASAVYPDITGPKVLDYVGHLKSYWPGIAPPVDFTKAPTNPYGPRVFAAWVAPTAFTDGSTYDRKGPFLSILTSKTDDNPVPKNCTTWVAGACAP
jgi:hypothetical protein